VVFRFRSELNHGGHCSKIVTFAIDDCSCKAFCEIAVKSEKLKDCLGRTFESVEAHDVVISGVNVSGGPESQPQIDGFIEVDR
jgi:hypothetical protein